MTTTFCSTSSVSAVVRGGQLVEQLVGRLRGADFRGVNAAADRERSPCASRPAAAPRPATACADRPAAGSRRESGSRFRMFSGALTMAAIVRWPSVVATEIDDPDAIGSGGDRLEVALDVVGAGELAVGCPSGSRSALRRRDLRAEAGRDAARSATPDERQQTRPEMRACDLGRRVVHHVAPCYREPPAMRCGVTLSRRCTCSTAVPRAWRSSRPGAPPDRPRIRRRSGCRSSAACTMPRCTPRPRP